MFIYIHLPFCLSRCTYCDFYTDRKPTDARRRTYLDALKKEISFYLSTSSNLFVETIYFGGGTPSLFLASEIRELVDTVKIFTPFNDDIEITMEANPEGMASSPADYREAGINRISVGAQSLQPNELRRLARIHSRDQVYRFIESLNQTGFKNISVDLMYGIPEQTMQSWMDTLEQAVSLDIDHVSIYGLKVEPGTMLECLLDKGSMYLPEEDEAVDMYFKGISFLEQNGFELYEISNLAQSGKESRHNLAYWNNEQFWGFGVSAHGYIGDYRYENPCDLDKYLLNPVNREENNFCTIEEKLENAFIFGLRKRSGVSVPDLERVYGFDFMSRYGLRLKPYFESGYISLQNGVLKLALKAIPVSNEILSVFIN